MDGKGNGLNLESGMDFNRKWLWLLAILLVVLIWYIIPKDEPATTKDKIENQEGSTPGQTTNPITGDDSADKEASEQAARNQAAKEQAAREEAAIKKVRFTLDKMLVIEDGDNDTGPFKDNGDFIWTISVNNRILAQNNNEREMDDGDEQTFNESADFELSEDGTSELELVADITDVDGGFNADNDRIKITYNYKLEDLDFSKNSVIKASKQGDNSGDPKVELFWTLELLPN